jgi:hypothetical protein
VSLTLRCSALPLAFLCPGSVRPGALAVNPTNDAAELGTGVHECLRTLARTGQADWDAVPDVARKHGVAEEELRALVGLAQKMWRDKLAASFPGARAEVPLGVTLPDGTVLTGTADILARSLACVHIGDWKSGRLDRDHREQLLGYCALALLNDPSLDEATAGVIWIRDDEFEHYTLTRAELPAYLRRLETVVIAWNGTFRPGSHCRHCPRSHECPARHALVRRDVAAFLGGELTSYATDSNLLETLPPETLIALSASADLVHELSAHVRTAIHELVERKGDIVGGGQRLTLQHTTRRHLKVIQAFPVLTAHGFGDDDFAQVVNISATKAEKVVASRASHGQGAATVRNFRAALEAADAIETEPVAQLVTKRA